jgi:hypothetical protein
VAGDLEEPGRQADLVFFAEPEDLGGRRAVDQGPGGDLALVPGDDRADVVDGQAEDRLEVAVPEVEPVGEGPGAEVDQGAPLHRQLVLERPGELGVEDLPAVLPLGRGDGPPGASEPRGADHPLELLGPGALRLDLERDTEGRRQLGPAGDPGLDHLLDVLLDEHLAGRPGRRQAGPGRRVDRGLVAP